MPLIDLPVFVTLKNARDFFRRSDFFAPGPEAILRLPTGWAFIEPFGLAMLAAWGRWCSQNNRPIRIENLGPTADYLWRMHLFEHLGVDYSPPRREREEAGRFLPIRQVRDGRDIRSVIAAISALLHLEEKPESLAAVQYSISELLRNVLEHSASEEGAFVCAHNFDRANPTRVTIAVADCGIGIREHLGRAHAAALVSDSEAILLALRPGITGALPGPYGTIDNAGAGLFITRSIAKGSGGYFLVASGNACYRLRRARGPLEQLELPLDATDDRHDMWDLHHPWNGTVVSMEIRSDQIEDFDQYFAWIRKFIPAREEVRRRIRFA